MAGVALVVSAGGGLKQMLLAVKIGDLIGHAASAAHLTPLCITWLAAALVRIVTGSATVATITAAGITAPLLTANPVVSPELMMKETFGLSLGDTFKSWSAMETLRSVLGLLAVLMLGTVVHG